MDSLTTLTTVVTFHGLLSGRPMGRGLEPAGAVSPLLLLSQTRADPSKAVSQRSAFASVLCCSLIVLCGLVADSARFWLALIVQQFVQGTYGYLICSLYIILMNVCDFKPGLTHSFRTRSKHMIHPGSLTWAEFINESVHMRIFSIVAPVTIWNLAVPAIH